MFMQWRWSWGPGGSVWEQFERLHLTVQRHFGTLLTRHIVLEQSGEGCHQMCKIQDESFVKVCESQESYFSDWMYGCPTVHCLHLLGVHEDAPGDSRDPRNSMVVWSNVHFSSLAYNPCCPNLSRTMQTCWVYCSGVSEKIRIPVR